MREAGGRAETLEGGPLTSDTTWIAANAALFTDFRALIAGGSDILLVETIFDSLNAKAALVAIQEVFDADKIHLPVSISAAVGRGGETMISAQTVEALWNAVKHIEPLSVEVLERIIANGSQSIPLTPPELEPAVPALRKKYPGMSDEERLLRYSYAGSQVDDMLAAGPMRTVYHFDKPIVRLLKELAKRPRAGRIHIEKGDFKLELNASA